MPSITHRFSILDVPVEADIEYRVTYRGHPGVAPSLSYPGDPPEAPEWDVERVSLSRVVPPDAVVSDNYDPSLQLPPWLEDAICHSTDVEMAIYEAIDEEDRHGYDDD